MSISFTVEVNNPDHKNERAAFPFLIAAMVSNYEHEDAFQTSWNENAHQLESDIKELTPKEIRYLIEDILLSRNPLTGFRLLHDCGVLKVVLPELDCCYGLTQDKRYHSDTVFDHCVKVASNTEATAYMRWSGLFHDIGKAAVRKENPDGSITFHKHEVHSTSIAKSVMERMCFSEPLQGRVLHLVSLHMYHYSSEWTDRAVWRFIRKAGFDKHDVLSIVEHWLPQQDLFLLRMADRQSRGLQPVTDKQRDFETRIIKVLKERIAKPSSD